MLEDGGLEPQQEKETRQRIWSLRCCLPTLRAIYSSNGAFWSIFFLFFPFPILIFAVIPKPHHFPQFPSNNSIFPCCDLNFRFCRSNHILFRLDPKWVLLRFWWGNRVVVSVVVFWKLLNKGHLSMLNNNTNFHKCVRDQA